MSFAALKKQSKAGSLTERLMKKVEKLNEKGGNNTDERLWNCLLYTSPSPRDRG